MPPPATATPGSTAPDLLPDVGDRGEPGFLQLRLQLPQLLLSPQFPFGHGECCAPFSAPIFLAGPGVALEAQRQKVTGTFPKGLGRSLAMAQYPAPVPGVALPRLTRWVAKPRAASSFMLSVKLVLASMCVPAA